MDKVLVQKGLVISRERAKALIMEGKVYLDGIAVTKAGTMVNANALIELKYTDFPFVSRGGLKLEAAIKTFDVELTDKIVMDVGSSTGGFTDCMLRYGAKQVYCVDVGYGQLSWKLRQDKRVVVLERTNIRYLQRSQIPDIIDLATIDVSFISLVKVVPTVLEFLKEGGEVIALIKPQFEVGKGEVDRGGIVKDDTKREKAVEAVKKNLESLGFQIAGLMESPILGQKGNKEYLLYLLKKIA
ncbi:MAG: TlyA family RNA methyltransferase [Dissulfurispiraceae bacterium]